MGVLEQAALEHTETAKRGDSILYPSEGDHSAVRGPRWREPLILDSGVEGRQLPESAPEGSLLCFQVGFLFRKLYGLLQTDTWEKKHTHTPAFIKA